MHQHLSQARVLARAGDELAKTFVGKEEERPRDNPGK